MEPLYCGRLGTNLSNEVDVWLAVAIDLGLSWYVYRSLISRLMKITRAVIEIKFAFTTVKVPDLHVATCIVR